MSQHLSVGKKGASELQELRADNHPGCTQVRDPQVAQR